jgi:hypothetical protein
MGLFCHKGYAKSGVNNVKMDICTFLRREILHVDGAFFDKTIAALVPLPRTSEDHQALPHTVSAQSTPPPPGSSTSLHRWPY